MPNRINQLIELDESQRNALDRSIKNQEKVKRTFDKFAKPRAFKIGDTILLWTNEGKTHVNMGSLIVPKWGYS